MRHFSLLHALFVALFLARGVVNNYFRIFNTNGPYLLLYYGILSQGRVGGSSLLVENLWEM